MAGKKWRIYRVRGDEVGERKRASSCGESKEWKFSSKSYVKPLNDFEKTKQNKTKNYVIHSVSLMVGI